MDVEGVEGGFGGIGDGEAGCVERGGHGGDRLAIGAFRIRFDPQRWTDTFSWCWG